VEKYRRLDRVSDFLTVCGGRPPLMQISKIDYVHRKINASFGLPPNLHAEETDPGNNPI
jgi:hypothetical protein